MNIKMAKTAEQKMELYTQRCQYILNQEMKNMLATLGSLAVEEAVNRPQSLSFYNHTGNLRSSIGYGVYRDGRKVAGGGFQPTDAPESNGHLGIWHGRRELTKAFLGTSEIASAKYSMGDAKFRLVVVAGMFYAGYVEAKPTKEVLAQAQLECEMMVKPSLQQAKARIKERIARIKI